MFSCVNQDLQNYDLIDWRNLMRYSYIVSVILMVAILTPVASAGVWQENFDNGLPDGWNDVSGEWKIVKDAYAETSGGQYAKTMSVMRIGRITPLRWM